MRGRLDGLSGEGFDVRGCIRADGSGGDRQGKTGADRSDSHRKARRSSSGSGARSDREGEERVPVRRDPVGRSSAGAALSLDPVPKPGRLLVVFTSDGLVKLLAQSLLDVVVAPDLLFEVAELIGQRRVG